MIGKMKFSQKGWKLKNLRNLLFKKWNKKRKEGKIGKKKIRKLMDTFKIIGMPDRVNGESGGVNQRDNTGNCPRTAEDTF